MILDLSPLVHSQNVGPLPLLRREPPTLTPQGDYEPAPEVALVLDPVAVHPLSGRDLEQLPEQVRHKGTIQLYTLARLRIGDGQVADAVEYRSRRYNITHADDYEQQGGVFTYYAALVDEGAV